MHVHGFALTSVPEGSGATRVSGQRIDASFLDEVEIAFLPLPQCRWDRARWDEQGDGVIQSA